MGNYVFFSVDTLFYGGSRCLARFLGNTVLGRQSAIHDNPHYHEHNFFHVNPTLEKPGEYRPLKSMG